MTLQELRDKIDFTVEILEGGRCRVKGELRVFATMIVPTEVANNQEEKRSVEDYLTERIFQRLYEDRRQEMHEALSAFLATDRGSVEFFQCRDRLMAAAHYQPWEGKA